jgi:abhydrolase domain-containing protein 13
MLMQLERKFNVLLVEYRGYGDSDKVPPNEYGLKLDSEAALNFCMNHNKIDSDNIFVYGQSLGGAVAFHLAQYCQGKLNMQIAGILVENTFLSISKMVDQLLPKIIVLLKPLVLRLNWNSEQIASTLQNVSILYLAGEKDELVPHQHMLQLFSLSTRANANIPNTIVQLHVVAEGTHNDTWMVGGQPYWNAMRHFLYSIVSRRMEIRTSGAYAASESQHDRRLSFGAPGSIHISASNTVVVPTMSTSILGMAQDAFVHHGKRAIDEKIKDH